MFISCVQWTTTRRVVSRQIYDAAAAAVGLSSVRNKGGSGGVRPLQKYVGPMQSCNMWGPWVGPIKPPIVKTEQGI